MLKSSLGFSLIELMITLVVLALLTLLAAPSLSAWMANNRVRASAEALQNALRLARGEAVHRSRQTVLALTADNPELAGTPQANAPNWYLKTLPLKGSDDTDGQFLRGETVASTHAVSIAGPALICFNAFGRMVGNSLTGLGANCATPGALTSYGLSASGADRPLRVEVYLGGRVRLCDPAKTLSPANPDGCA